MAIQSKHLWTATLPTAPRSDAFSLSLSLSIVAITAIIALIAPTPAGAESASSTINFSVSQVISLNIANCAGLPDSDSSSITLDVDPTAAGSFVSNCQTLAIATNTPGHSLSVKALSSDSSNNLIYQNPTSLSPKPTITPITANLTSAPTTITPNHWGFAAKGANIALNPNISTNPGLNFTGTYTTNNQSNVYSTLPTSDTQLYATSNLPGQVDQVNFWYGTNVNLSQLAGSYATTITYTVIGNMVPCQWDNSISFDDPGCVEPYYLAQAVADNNITTMQQLTGALCQSAIYDNTNKGVNSNNTVTLTDTRNNQDYMVRKLADNNCWQINNLRIALSDVAANPSASDPKLDNTALAALNDQTSPDNSGLASFNQPRYYDPTCGATNAPANCATTNNSDSTFYGYLYNWCAAMGGTTASCKASGTYPTDLDGNAANGGNYDPLNTASICPVNWRLPTGGATGEYAILNGSMFNNAPSTANTSTDSTYAANWLYEAAFQGVFSGYWSSGFGYQGSYAYLWSSSANPSNSYNAHYVSFSSSDVVPAYGNGRNNGFAVRCVVGN